MAYCPNCGTNIEATAPKCLKCHAAFHAADGWKPSETPVAAARGPSLLYLFGRMLVWAGHFFLIGVPVLFVLYHLLFYRGGGTSGVPLAFSIMFSFVLYVPGYLLAFVGRDKAV
jgi:hypothetical protein